MSDPVLCRMVCDPRTAMRWAAVRETQPGRGVGPLRRAPRTGCATCSSPAPLVVASAYDDHGRPAQELASCRRHVEQIAMARLTESRDRVSSYPARRTWTVWWRSAPLAVAWRNARARVPREPDDHLPATDAESPLGTRLFRERPSLW